MNQKLSNWASIAEIVSSIAVVVTLIFLILGIRENTEVVRAGSYDRSIDSINQVAVAMAQDENLARFYELYEDGRLDELSSDEWYRLRLVIRTQFRNYETAYYAEQYGTLGQSEWGRFETQICRQRSRLDSTRWDTIQVVLTDAFVGYIEDLCNSAP